MKITLMILTPSSLLKILGLALIPSGLSLFLNGAEIEPKKDRPNIVLILADDLGYGDLSCYGAQKIKTPNVDRVAAEGIRFTDGHSSASTCTPSRFSMLTGMYPFRQKGTGIIGGQTGLIIQPGKTTLPSMLQGAGYTTGIVGKWHLGLGSSPTNYNVEITPGPLDVGFNYAWIMPATGDRVPCVWVENRRVANLDPKDPIRLDNSVTRGSPRSIINGIPRCGEQIGGKAALWEDDKISSVIASKSREFIKLHREKPFFLEVATHNIHVPRVPGPLFRGKSECGLRGDAILEFDWTVGEIVKALEEFKLSDQTLIIISSDNGGTLDNNGPTDLEHGLGSKTANDGHAFNGPLRGAKGSIWEGGNRVPFIIRWLGHVSPGVSNALVCQIDFLASFAALTGQSIKEGEGRDSVNTLTAFLQVETSIKGRQILMLQDNSGSALALREEGWKLVQQSTKGKKNKKNEIPAVLPLELYNLNEDLSETTDLASKYPEKVKSMQLQMDQIFQNK